MSRRNKDNYVSESQTIETLMLQWDNELAMQASFEECREEGIEFVVINMLRSDMTVDKIQELTQLSSERIQKIADSLVK